MAIDKFIYQDLIAVPKVMRRFMDLPATKVWVSQTFFREHFTGHLGLTTICSFRWVNVTYSVYSHECDLCFSSKRFRAWAELISEGHPQGELQDWRYS